jgi:Protein of unknown function DUF262
MRKTRGKTMKAFDVRAYSIGDFIEWSESGKLELSPDFQRRSVWSSTAKAFLADTILRGKPFPKIILMQEFKDGRTIRVVVDGQQRLRAIFDFVNDGVKISRAHNKDFAGRTFSQLPQDLQNEFRQYEIGCDVLNEAPYGELLDIFARINRYTVKLNAQELRNAQYSGFFKTTAYSIGHRYVLDWINGGVLTKASVSRMSEAELASDLLATFLVQIQSNKAIDTTYKRFEEVEDGVPEASIYLEKAIELAFAIYPPSELEESAWSSKHLYYTLLTFVGHLFRPFENVNETSLTAEALTDVEKIRSVLNGISADYQQFSPQPMRAMTPEHLKRFMRASTLATTDATARVERTNYVLSVVEKFFGNS